MFYEYHTIPTSEKIVYIYSKLSAVLIISFFSLLLVLNNQSKKWQILYSICSYLYIIQGNFFRADYEMAYFQFLFPQSVYFNYSKKLFWKIHIIGTILFLFSISHNYESNLMRKVASESILDSFSILAVNLAIGIIVFSRLNTAEQNTKLFKEKLMLMGNQAAILIHDLKSLSTAPQIYLEHLIEKQVNLPEEEKRLFINLKQDLDSLTCRTKQIYSIIQNNSSSDFESISESIIVVKSLLKSRLDNVQLTINIQHEVKFQKGLFELILLNLFYNSLKAFQEHQIKHPKISINVYANKIEFADNAGGIPLNIIDNFNDDDSPPTSGLGLYLIKDSAAKHSISCKLIPLSNLEEIGTKFIFEF